jgi:8-oxo-dGTP pyrophosphatase MutT (NUDIX family)
VPVTKRKAYAYIVHAGRLLVFRHRDFPEAGIQVPGGTMLPEENPQAAVLREAAEETGLSELKIVSMLGEQMRDMSDFGRDEIQQRYFFLLACTQDPPETWTHFETDPSDGSSAPIAFEFFWAELPNSVPALAGEQDYFVSRMLDQLFGSGKHSQPDQTS